MKCPECEGEVQELGENAFCLECQWDNLSPLDEEEEQDYHSWYRNGTFFCVHNITEIHTFISPFTFNCHPLQYNADVSFWTNPHRENSVCVGRWYIQKHQAINYNFFTAVLRGNFQLRIELEDGRKYEIPFHMEVSHDELS